jgi:hypothetical protein
MNFRIQGLDFALFQHLVGLSDEDLRARGVVRVVADSTPGFPDRIELRDAEPGEQLLLLNYLHQPAAGPYQASHAIYVLEHPGRRFDRINEIPSVLRSRMISLRAFDSQGMITQAKLCAGTELEPAIDALLAEAGTEYVHLHYATRGCFACRIDRA